MKKVILLATAFMFVTGVAKITGLELCVLGLGLG
jgi:hypothetical protein